MQLEWESLEKLQVVSPSFCLKPIDSHVLREVHNDSSSSGDDHENEDEDDDDEEFCYNDKDEEEEQYYEEKLQRELQAKLNEFDQCETKEGASSISKLEEKTKRGGTEWIAVLKVDSKHTLNARLSLKTYCSDV